MDSFWIILTGALVGSSCALLGCFLVLRKNTMIGDAISHAVLPGIVLAYLIAQSRASLVMLIGAGIFGVLITLLIETLHKQGKMQMDAAIGLSFTWLFALGVILISAFTGQVDLDQDCVLYGEIAYVPLDLGWLDLPRQVWILGILLLVLLVFIFVAYRGLFITTFDETFAASLGISTLFWHYVLMSAVSFTTVLSFESVGAILVVGFLVGPPATAYLLTNQLPKMLALAVLLSILASLGGYFLAVWVNGSIAGAMASVIGIEFALAFIWRNFIVIIPNKELKINEL